MESIVIFKELKEFIIPLSEQEFQRLEKNLIEDGCRDPLILWRNGTESVLVDGHNRYKICKKHEIPFKTEFLDFNTLDDVKVWMVDNQMGRRNLTPDQLSYYRGLKYLSLKRKKGGYESVAAKGQQELTTSEYLADKFNVSESTVKRDAKFTQGLHIIQRTNPRLKVKILTGEVKVKKSDIQALAESTDPDNLIIRNEADLHNKAKLIREEILGDAEKSIRSIELKEQSQLQDVDAIEPLFLSREDRLRKTKGKILNAINRAITDRDVDAIEELKKLITKLELELFD